MTEQTIQVSWDQMKWFIGGALTVLTTAVGCVWKIMEGQVKHWKELHEAKERELVAARKENEEVKKNPTDVAVRYVTMAEAFLSSQIAKLEEAVCNLKADCAAKEEEIQKITKAATENEERFVYAQEAKESLERKIAAYEEILQRLVRRKNLTEEVISSFRSQTFDVEHIEAETQSEINERIREIDRTSFGRYSQAMRQAASAKHAGAEAAANQQMKQRLAELKDAEEKAEARMKARAQLSPDGTEARTQKPGKSLPTSWCSTPALVNYQVSKVGNRNQFLCAGQIAFWALVVGIAPCRRITAPRRNPNNNNPTSFPADNWAETFARSGADR